MNDNHQGSEDVHANRNEPLLALGALVFDRKRRRIAEDSVAFGKRNTVLLDVCRFLLRIELSGHGESICTLYIYVNPAVACRAPLSLQRNEQHAAYDEQATHGLYPSERLAQADRARHG